MDYTSPTPVVVETEKVATQIRECASDCSRTKCESLDDACYFCSGACTSFRDCSLWDEFLKLVRKAT